MHDVSIQSEIQAQDSTPSTVVTPLHEEFIYAGFWRRWAAYYWDCLICVGFVLVALVPLILLKGDLSDSENIIVEILIAICSTCYYVLMESGSKCATYGKQWVGIQVVDITGKRISRKMALARAILRALSALPLFAGYLMQPFTKRKQALHDMACKTIVIENKEASPSSIIFTRMGIAISLLISLTMFVTVLKELGYIG